MFFFIVNTCLCALSERSTRPFVPFCQSFSVEAPYILHALPSQTVFDFLSQWHNKVCHFISDIMDNFLAGKDQQQTNQPNDQAGGTLTCKLVASGQNTPCSCDPLYLCASIYVHDLSVSGGWQGLPGVA